MTFELQPIRSTRLGWLTVAALVLTGAAVRAQTPNPSERPAYRLGIADVIEVLIPGEADYSTIPPGITVGPDGRVGFPSLGAIVAEGKTCDELAAAIAKGLRERNILLQPDVLVRVSEAHYQKINVIGAVHTPGTFPFRPGTDVRDAIALGGGLVLDTATGAVNQMRGRVIHRDGNSEAIKLDEVLSGSGPAPALQAGDTVVLEVQDSVSVLGYVTRPGSYNVHAGTRLSAVVAQAGGTAGASGMAELGDLRHLLVNRADGTKVEVDLKRVLAGQGGDDPTVAPGDVIYVPPSVQDAAVVGYVQQPGRYPFREGDRVSDLLAQAKGALVGPPRGDLTRAVLVRSDGTTQTLDLTKALSGPATEETNPRLRPGDTLTVPEAQTRAIVSGYVKTPGYYDFRPGDTVRTALALAGGVVPNYGSESAVVVRHLDGTQVALNLEKDNAVLQPGDDVTVPFTRHKVTVTGYVTTPGQYEWEKGDTVVDKIAQANGSLLSRETSGFLTEKGHPTRAMLIRQENGEYKITTLDFSRFYKLGDKSQNPEVQPGDIILVPRKATLDYERVLRDLLLIPTILNVFTPTTTTK
jgi:polysaccharide export outer membrane protein